MSGQDRDTPGCVIISYLYRAIVGQSVSTDIKYRQSQPIYHHWITSGTNDGEISQVRF